MATDFDRIIKEMEREILELKTGQQMTSRIKAYTFRTTLSDLGATTSSLGHIRVTYGEASGEILTEFVSDISIWPATPSGSTQDANCMAYTGSAALRAPIFIMSTHPIQSVQLIE